MERPERAERPEFPNRATAGGRASGPSTPEGCLQEDDDARVEALNALMQMDADRALPVLEKVMARRDRCSVLLRRKAVFLVSQKRSTDGTALLIDAIKNDPDSEVREQAVFWLGQSGGEDAVTVLADLVRIARNEDVRKKAVFALAQTRSPRASAALRDLVNDEKAPVELRKDGIFWLGQMSGRSTETVTLLSGLYGTIRQDELKDQILFAMSQQRSPAAAAFLRRVAGDDAEQMERRESAIFWFGQSTGTSDELMAIYRAEKAVAVKDKIIFALSQHRRDPKAVDHLLSIAKTESNRELRKSAIFWLSQSKDARVAQFLQELIDK
jgi:hypothetical protein